MGKMKNEITFLEGGIVQIVGTCSPEYPDKRSLFQLRDIELLSTYLTRKNGSNNILEGPYHKVEIHFFSGHEITLWSIDAKDLQELENRYIQMKGGLN